VVAELRLHRSLYFTNCGAKYDFLEFADHLAPAELPKISTALP
jgi:hypothetical protein